MGIRRVVPNIVSAQPDLSRDFYIQFFGLRVKMDMGRIATYVSPSNPTAQIIVVQEGAEPYPSRVSLSVEVDDVDRAYDFEVKA